MDCQLGTTAQLYVESIHVKLTIVICGRQA